MPSLSEAPSGGAKTFWLLLGRLCTDRTHGGHMCGDMVDTLWSVIRLIYVNSPQKVMAEVDVK